MSLEGERKRPGNIQQVVRAILTTCDGFVGVGKRASGENEAGKWCLIGGKADGDVLSKELLREVAEETGTQIEVLSDETKTKLAFYIDRIKDGVVWRNNYFILEIDDLQVPSIMANFNRGEFSEVAFVSEEDLKGLRFAFGNGRVVRDFFKYVGN